MRVVDAHFHIWDLQENYYPWLVDEPPRKMIIGDYTPIRRNYLITDYLRDASSIDLVAAVHVQAEHDERDHVRETRWLQGVADRAGSRGVPQAIVANADLQAPDAPAVLEAHAAFPNLRGIRQAVHRWLASTPPYDPLLDPVWTGNFGLLGPLGLSFDLQVFPQQIEPCLALIRRYPGTTFVLTHLGLPLWPEPEARAVWARNVARYAEMPNVVCKLSGFSLLGRDWTAESVAPVVDHVVSCFGVERCLVASNYPVESLSKTYGELWAEYGRLFRSWSDDERDQLFARNAARIYRISI